MVATSFKPSGIAKQLPPVWIFKPTFSHYVQVLQGGTGTSVGFDRLLFNSAAVTIGSTLLTIALAVPAAYALSLRAFRQRNGLSSWILSTYMFPPIVAVIPIFIYAGKLGLIDTYPVLIIPYAAFNLPDRGLDPAQHASCRSRTRSRNPRWSTAPHAGMVLRQIILPLLVRPLPRPPILSAILVLERVPVRPVPDPGGGQDRAGRHPGVHRHVRNRLGQPHRGRHGNRRTHRDHDLDPAPPDRVRPDLRSCQMTATADCNTRHAGRLASPVTGRSLSTNAPSPSPDRARC